MGKVVRIRSIKAEKRARKIIEDFKKLSEKISYEPVYHYYVRTTFYQRFLNTVSSMRMKLYYEMLADPELNFYVQEFAKKDFVAWVNLFGWTYNPVHTDNNITPFVLYQYHIDYYEKTKRYKKTIIIKSRTMGYTWLKAFIKTFRFLYDDDYKSLITSRVESDIDIVGDRERTIMGRIRFILESLPYFSLGLIDIDKELSLRYRENTIRGVTSNPDALRSMRGTEVDVEEAGVIENFDMIMASAVSVAKELRLGGTVKGTINGFYDFWKNKDNAYHHMFWNYMLHPIFNTQDWANKELEKYNNDERLFRQEVLGDFFAMVGNIILTELEFRFLISMKRKDFSSPYIKKAVSIDPGLGSSLTAIWCYYYDEEKNFFYYVDYAEVEGGIARDIAKKIKDMGFGDSDVYLIDKYGGNRDSSGSSWANNLANDGLTPIYLVDNKNITGSILVANKMLREERIWFNKDSKNVQHGFERLTRYVYVDRYGADKQKKDDNSDCGDSFRYSMVIPYLTNAGIKGHSRARVHQEVLMNSSYKFLGTNETIMEKGYKPLTLYRGR